MKICIEGIESAQEWLICNCFRSERTVDLNDLWFQLAEIMEVRVAGSKVIQRQTDSGYQCRNEKDRAAAGSGDRGIDRERSSGTKYK